MEFPQLGGLAERLDDEVERRVGKLVKGNDHGLIRIDTGVTLQHDLHLFDDGVHLADVIVTQANSRANTAMRHTRRVLHHDGRKQSIGHVDQCHVGRADLGLTPADMFHLAFDLLVR